MDEQKRFNARAQKALDCAHDGLPPSVQIEYDQEFIPVLRARNYTVSRIDILFKLDLKLK